MVHIIYWYKYEVSHSAVGIISQISYLMQKESLGHVHFTIERGDRELECYRENNENEHTYKHL